MTAFTYDGADRLTGITYPTGEVVSQAYNGRGLPKTLSSTVSNVLVSDTLYNQLGLPTRIDLGNGTRTTYGYWDMSGSDNNPGGYYGRLWKIKTVQTGGSQSTLQEVKHTWDQGGNLTIRQNVKDNETENFVYDHLDRVTSAWVAGGYSESYVYNQIGNITSKNGTGYTYGGKPHAVTSAGSTNYIYDGNGNMTTRGTASLTWDAENRLTAVSGGVSYVYDGDGFRVKKTEGGQTILYVNKYYEKNLTTATAALYYYLGDKMVAYKEGTALRYVYNDHLTGTSVGADTSGAVVGNINYKPYGETRSLSGDFPSQKFTGQRLDGVGLYYYGARYYDPGIGRFISADTIVSNPYNPQSLNRYAYTLNNPLKYVDPDGRIAFLAIIAIAVAVANWGGIAYDAYHFYKDPSGENAGWLALDLVDPSPVPIGGVAKGAGKVIKAIEEGKSIEKVAERTGKAVGGAKDVARITEQTVSTERGLIISSEGFGSFGKLKQSIGSPGKGKIWHHIVEQSQIERSGFDARLIQNPKNVVSMDEATNIKINAYYSSKQDFTGGRTVRDWLAGQSYEAQYAFGTDILKKLQ